MSKKMLLRTLPVIAAAGIGFFAYTSCDQLPDEKTGATSSENTNDSNADIDNANTAVPVGKGVVCDALIGMESYPVQYIQNCKVNDICSETIVIPVSEDGDVATLKVYVKENKESLVFSYDEDKKAILMDKDHCPGSGKEFSVSYTGMTNEQLNNSSIDSENFSCTSTVAESEPASIKTMCKVKEACIATGVYQIPLHTFFSPVNGMVELSRKDQKQPSIVLAYDANKHEVAIPANQCLEKDLEFVISYNGLVKEYECNDGGDCTDSPASGD